jgi:hypothetical protein
MIIKITSIILLIQMGVFGGYPRNNNPKIGNQEKSKEKQNMHPNPQEISTKFSSRETLVLQILTDIKVGKSTVHGKEAFRSYVLVFIPNSSGGTISCPLNYFQESVSLPEKWFINDVKQKIEISNVDNLKKIIMTKKTNGIEDIIELPNEYSKRLFDYFMLDVSHNESIYNGFDCYAFASSIGNVKYYPLSPGFDYKDAPPSIGDIVVLTNGSNLPESIMHWAIYLGDNQYLSKFGKTGEGTSSLITVMDLEGMKFLYESNLTFTAIPKTNAKAWEGYIP